MGTRNLAVAAFSIIALLSSGTLPAAGDLTASIRLVLSTRDGMAQVQLRAEAEGGLRMLHVFAPDRKLAVKVVSRDSGRKGQGALFFETEESSLEDTRDAWPAGRYRFVAWTPSGEVLEAEAVLSDVLPRAPVITFPRDGETDVPPAPLAVSWQPVDGAEGFRVEVDEEETETGLTVDLPPERTGFNLPVGWLAAGRVYTLDVMVIGAGGNVTVSDISFRTAD